MNMDQTLREAEVRTVYGDPASDPEGTSALARIPSDAVIPDRVFNVAAALLAYLAAVEEGAPPSLSR